MAEILSAQKLLVKYHNLPVEIQSKQVKVDSSKIELLPKSILSDLRDQGYWAAEVDTVYIDDNSVHVITAPGRKFSHLMVSFSGQYPLQNTSQRPISLGRQLTRFNKTIDEQIKDFENNGYPFARFDLDSVNWNNDSLWIAMKLNPGIKITYDSLVIDPPDIVSSSFVMRYLGLPTGAVYSEQSVQRIKRKMENLQFLYLNNAQVAFRLKRAEVKLDIEKRNTSYFDGIIGMLPNQEENSGVIFTGEVNLGIDNLFRSAKSLEIHWQRLMPETQSLFTKYRHPLLLGTPLNFNFRFDQIKQDSTFSNRTLYSGFDYFITPKLNMLVDYENKLGNELEGVAMNTADFELNQYGIGLIYRDYDDNLDPKEGFSVSTDVSTGVKEVTSEDLSEPSSTQYDLTMDLEVLQKTGKKTVFAFKSGLGKLINDNLYLNDLYRLGGLRSVRGFNEGEFFASEYAVVSGEYRIYLDPTSYFVTFYDQGFFAYNIVNENYFDRASAMGIGMKIKSKNGNFLVLYGLGKVAGQSFSFDSSKIHFGYSALF